GAVVIFVGGNVAESDGVGLEQKGKFGIFGDGQDDIAGIANLLSEELIGLRERTILHLDGSMIGPEFAENNIEGDGFGALLCKLVSEAAIDLPRPVEAKTVAEHAVGVDEIDAAFVDENKSQIGG